MQNRMFKVAATTAVMIMCVGSSARVVFAGEQQGHGNQGRFDDFDRFKKLVVLSATVDMENETVTLHGLNFGKKAQSVFCETDRMKVVRWSDTEIVVRFPKAVQDGSYLFTVARGNFDLERGDFYVTKVTSSAGGAGGGGAQGPAGPQGPAGAQGPEGPAGAVGATGPAGATGAAGPAGPVGPQGPQGAPGAPGLPGGQGPAGPAGPAGGVSGYERVQVVNDPPFSLALNSTAAPVVALCPAGKVPVGGGYEPVALTNSAIWLTPVQSSPLFTEDGQSGWSVTLRNNTSSTKGSVQVVVSVLCALPQ